MIVSLRGTHGSGKSTVVKSILSRYPTEEIVGPDGKIEGYKTSPAWSMLPIYVVGPYKTACGGCDAINPYTLIWPRVDDYAGKGHVLFEGALVSSSYGNIGRALEKYGDDVVFAFMDTPVEECLDRIRRRREARDVTKPMNPKNTVNKYQSVLRSVKVIREKWNRRVVMIDHRKATAQILGLFVNAEKESYKCQ